MSKTVKIVLAVGVVFIVLAGAGVWYFVLRDTAEKEVSLDALGQTAATAAPGAKTQSTPDGNWKVQQGSEVFAGYRMQELFAGGAAKKTATGRSPKVDGTMVIKGDEVTAVTIDVDTTALKSDESRRDAQVSQRGLETQKFPKASFKLTSPIKLSSIAKDTEVSATAKGELTMHGVTKPVEVPVKAKWNGSNIIVTGSIPIALADYNIEPINVPGFVTIDDNGTMEMQLLFVPA